MPPSQSRLFEADQPLDVIGAEIGETAFEYRPGVARDVMRPGCREESVQLFAANSGTDVVFDHRAHYPDIPSGGRYARQASDSATVLTISLRPASNRAMYALRNSASAIYPSRPSGAV